MASYTESEAKQFVISQGATTGTKKYTSPTAYSVVLVKGGTTLTLTSTEFTDFAAVVDAVLAQTYTDI